jgi:hypothetical protein
VKNTRTYESYEEEEVGQESDTVTGGVPTRAIRKSRREECQKIREDLRK